MRDLILKALKKEGHISGEQLAKKLKISRTAVWKHIKELRKMGYQIDSLPHYGYSYIKSTSLLVPEEITVGLGNHIIGKHVLHHNEVTSTQDVADKLARGGAEEGLVVIAEKQTSGRGRRGRTWSSPDKSGIYLSVLLRPDLKPIHIIQIPLVAGVAVARAIQSITPLKPSIKWPNDIYIGNKKVAGILTEVNCDIDTVHYIVLGIGINVNTSTASFPKSIKTIATSISSEHKQKISRVSLLRQFLVEFEKVYIEFIAHGFSAIAPQWKNYNNTIGSHIKVSEGSKVITGKALDIDDDGFLIIESDDGEIKRIINADVSLNN